MNSASAGTVEKLVPIVIIICVVALLGWRIVRRTREKRRAAAQLRSREEQFRDTRR